jgi:hypothetical protein
MTRWISLVILPLLPAFAGGVQPTEPPVGVVSNIQVLSDKVPGLDWKQIARAVKAGKHEVDLTPLVLRRYDYRLKFEFRGKGTGLDALRFVHDVQHSQRPLPALGKGHNQLTFRAGPAEGTVTVEGSTNLASKGKQLVWSDFHPEVVGFEPNLFIGPSGRGSITFPVTTPGDLVRLRFGAHYRARDAQDGWITRYPSTAASHGRPSIALPAPRRAIVSTWFSQPFPPPRGKHWCASPAPAATPPACSISASTPTTAKHTAVSGRLR